MSDRPFEDRSTDLYIESILADNDKLRARIAVLEDVLKLALSVTSEDRVREELLCYTQGTRLLEALEKAKEDGDADTAK